MLPGVSGAPSRQVTFTSDKRFVRRARALKTMETMVRMYCRRHHHPGGGALCGECAALLEYARRRLERCVFGDAKPTCANCVVHCYKADMRERMRVVMRWAGPRMLLRHPLMAIVHWLEGRRPAPMLPARAARARVTAADVPGKLEPQAPQSQGQDSTGSES